MDTFTAPEEKFLREFLARGEMPTCPRCGGVLETTRIPPQSAVPYVRDRIWLRCMVCDCMAVVDRPRG